MEPRSTITVTGLAAHANGRHCEAITTATRRHGRAGEPCDSPVMGIVIDSSPDGLALCVSHLVEYYQHQDDSEAIAAERSGDRACQYRQSRTMTAFVDDDGTADTHVPWPAEPDDSTPMTRYLVTCPDGEIRHQVFSARPAAEYWADYGHFCLSGHTIARFPR